MKIYYLLLILISICPEWAYSQNNDRYWICHSLILGYHFTEAIPYFDLGIDALITLDYGISRDDFAYTNQFGMDSVNYTVGKYHRTDSFSIDFDTHGRLVRIEHPDKRVVISYKEKAIAYEWHFYQSDSSDFPRFLELEIDEDGFPVALLILSETNRLYQFEQKDHGLMEGKEFINGEIFQVHFFTFRKEGRRNWSIFNIESGWIYQKSYVDNWSSCVVSDEVELSYPRLIYKPVKSGDPSVYQEFLIQEAFLREEIGVGRIILIGDK